MCVAKGDDGVKDKLCGCTSEGLFFFLTSQGVSTRPVAGVKGGQ